MALYESEYCIVLQQTKTETANNNKLALTWEQTNVNWGYCSRRRITDEKLRAHLRFVSAYCHSQATNHTLHVTTPVINSTGHLMKFLYYPQRGSEAIVFSAECVCLKHLLYFKSWLHSHAIITNTCNIWIIWYVSLLHNDLKTIADIWRNTLQVRTSRSHIKMMVSFWRV